jgi:5-(carboxyamino)imidazole ribonucleotide mutase
MAEPLVGIIMGSDSDLPVMKAAAEMLEQLQIPHEVTIVSAHRTPQRMVAYGESAEQRGLKVIIAGAGGAAHLPGMVAALTTVPVIGVPVRTSSLSGLDSLLSIVQMPGGIPVATVAINQAKNAGLLAAQIVATSDADTRTRLNELRESTRDEVLDKAARLEAIGFREYLGEA